MDKAEKQWIDAIMEIGCIVCRDYGEGFNPECEVHHLVEGGSRLGHLYSIPLCQWHHRGGHDQTVSMHSINGKHGGKAAFEKAFATEHVLLERCMDLTGLDLVA